MRPGVIKLPGETTGENLSEFEFGKRFLRHDTKATHKPVVNLAMVKINIFCTSKDTIKKMKRQVTIWEKIFATHIYDKELASRI